MTGEIEPSAGRVHLGGDQYKSDDGTGAKGQVAGGVKGTGNTGGAGLAGRTGDAEGPVGASIRCVLEVRTCFVDVYVLKRLEKDLLRAKSLANAVGSLSAEPSSSGGTGELLALMDEQQTRAPFASLSGNFMCRRNAILPTRRD